MELIGSTSLWRAAYCAAMSFAGQPVATRGSAVRAKRRGGLFSGLGVVCASVVFTGGCATLPRSFTAENVVSINQGMSSDEIARMFGNPKSVRQAVCGASTGRSWTCTTWEYGEFPYDRASFTFGSEGGSLVLNNFEVHRTGGALPAAFTSENVMKVRQGIGAEDIVRMFGVPTSVRQAVCGSATGSPWTCTTWEYGEFPYDRASFTFATRDGSLVLNNFEVQRK